MLKGHNPLLDANLLYVLAAMGHGDELALVDRNFPAVSTARRLVPPPGADATAAILSVMPLDTFVNEPIVRMEIVGAPTQISSVHADVLSVCEAVEGGPLEMGSISRGAFYEGARQAFAVVATSEHRPYGCFLLKKGVVDNVA